MACSNRPKAVSTGVRTPVEAVGTRGVMSSRSKATGSHDISRRLTYLDGQMRNSENPGPAADFDHA